MNLWKIGSRPRKIAPLMPVLKTVCWVALYQSERLMLNHLLGVTKVRSRPRTLVFAIYSHRSFSKRTILNVCILLLPLRFWDYLPFLFFFDSPSLSVCLPGSLPVSLRDASILISLQAPHINHFLHTCMRYGLALTHSNHFYFIENIGKNSSFSNYLAYQSRFCRCDASTGQIEQRTK